MAGGRQRDHGPSGEESPVAEPSTRKEHALNSTRLLFLSTAAFVFVADIVTKRLIVTNFQLHEVQQIIGDWVRLTYIHNPGAAFGLFPGSRVPLILISLAAVVVVVAVAWNRKGQLGTVVPLGLILGGALGNLVDRIRMGQVVDFVQVGIPPDMYWPVFNVADSAVTVGVTWLAVGLVLSGRHREETGETGDTGEGGEAVPGETAGAAGGPDSGEGGGVGRVAPSRDRV